MEDNRIVDLYWERSENAITETKNKYERYLMTIALNVLSDHSDSEEAVNDTYFKAWNSMPDERPSILSAFLGKITREGAIDIYRKRNASKRRDSQYALSLDELAECISEDSPVENAIDETMNEKALAEAINIFLRSLPELKRNIFICRYFYMDPIANIARKAGLSEVNTRNMLFRIRKDLKKYLVEEGLIYE